MPKDLLSSDSEIKNDLTKDDILDNLMEDDEEKEDSEGKEKREEDEEPKEDEDKEEGKEGEEEEEVKLKDEDEGKLDEDELELTVPVRRKAILAKYPQLFKDFPYLERAYYREQQFTEIFPTLDDAKSAIDKAEALDKFEKDVMEGTTEPVLKAVKETDPKIFAKLVDNYLPNLAKVDENAYIHVVGNVIKSTLNHMTREGKRLGENGEPLRIAAQLVNQFVFGTTELSEPSILSKKTEEDVEGQKLKKDREEFVKERFNIANSDLTTKVQNVLKSTISANIDPKDSMTDYVRKTAVRDAYENLENLMGQDTRFRAILDKLWEKAFQENFSKNSLDRIRSAYLSKAKTLLPTIIRKSRNDALKGLGKRISDEKDDHDKRGPLPVGRTASPHGERKPKEVAKGMKTIDYLMQD